MNSGPTQNYADPSLAVRRARPVLALAVRTGVVVGPVALAVLVGLLAALWFPPARLGLPVWLWLVGLVLVTSAALFACSRGLRRLTPLPALLKLSLVLPDDVPHRFSLAQHRWSPAALAETVDQGSGPGRRLLALVGTLAAHDDRTRAHGERVQAYAALIGEEMGLSAADVDRLSWAALLHDVGKVHVPVAVINKDGRPSEEEWAQLQAHPHHGGELVEPLRGWLGDWLDGVEQHHERWDGKGYPRRLAGEDISLAARIIAVADTYDVITSARSYKKPMTAEQARVEITRCAGEQFDPAVVRALLGVGIGALRRVAGPATLLAALPFAVAAPAQAAAVVTSATSTAGAQALTAVAVAVVGVGGGLTSAHALDLPSAAASPRTLVAAALAGDDDDGAASVLAGAGAVSDRATGADGVPGPSATPADPSGSAAVETPWASGPGGTTGTPGTGLLAADGTSAGSAPAGAPSAAPSTAPSTAPTGSAPPRVPSGTSSSSGVEAPRTSVSVPGVTVPPVSVPGVTLPPVSVPGVTLPPVSVPGVTVPPVSVPGVTLPPVSVPTSIPTSIPTGLPRIPGLGG